MPRPEPFDVARQRGTVGPKFARLAQVLDRGANPIELRADPTALAPERLLVFEVRGAVSAFATAIRRVPGLELVDEEELSSDEDDKEPVAYLMMPDIEALRQLESLWRRWLRGQLVMGETPWRDVFQTLRELRTWGPQDRVQPADAAQLADEIEGRGEDEFVRLEIELIFRAQRAFGVRSEDDVRTDVIRRGGRVISSARIDDIAYHALLVDLTVRSVREMIEQRVGGILGLEAVMHIRPQSSATSIETADPEPSAELVAGATALGEPIAALLDGVPVAAHPLVNRHVVLDDAFDLERGALVANRMHGTAMASLIIHGDRNRPEAPIPRRVHVVPVLGNQDAFPEDRLIVDLIYLAIVRMRAGDAPTAPNVILVNLSLGNKRRPFHGQLSAWARLLDRLAYQFGVLFLVSAGNSSGSFGVPGFISRAELEAANGRARAVAIVRALGAIVADRRLFAPAETVNGITVGACNDDAIDPAARVAARVNVDPFPGHRLANPSSTLGPGFARSVKPDILMPGSREHVMVVRNHDHIDVRPVGPSRFAGLKVAAPPAAGRESSETFTCGTSAATALATRTCHRIHDALEAAYGELFTSLVQHQRAVLLKALLVHPATWPAESAALIREVLGPADGRQHVRQKDNIRRFLGFGWVDADEAVACAEDRATFWATGTLHANRIVNVTVPIPQAISGQARLHSLSATLAWFTPVAPGRKRYRTCRLRILEPTGLGDLTVGAHSDQPDTNQTNRGTVFTRCWRGDRAPIVGPNHSIVLSIQRDPDQGSAVDDPIPFGLAVTIAMPGVVGIYEQVRQRLQPQVRAST
ncbi:S8 family peptidase [Polymorphobacter multimanifer]|uniref:Peptidase S8/S53 domain-containing protein n=1 Tax=Polymorphobacter multimanifer TaxID=1070431 RepID=A0A841L2Z1_9SPHN|nr:S8 family peptidase [Polymorphobacter multimanifer]MBB6226790.1 hypothetical protein [Polymorphobacter multimanifer]